MLNYGQIVELYDLSKELNIPMNMLDLEFVYEPEYPQGRESLYKSLQSSSLPFVEKKIEDFQEQDAFNKVVFASHLLYWMKQSRRYRRTSTASIR